MGDMLFPLSPRSPWTVKPTHVDKRSIWFDNRPRNDRGAAVWMQQKRRMHLIHGITILKNHTSDAQTECRRCFTRKDMLYSVALSVAPSHDGSVESITTVCLLIKTPRNQPPHCSCPAWRPSLWSNSKNDMMADFSLLRSSRSPWYSSSRNPAADCALMASRIEIQGPRAPSLLLLKRWRYVQTKGLVVFFCFSATWPVPTRKS